MQPLFKLFNRHDAISLIGSVTCFPLLFLGTSIVKIDELSARMEEIYDDFDDGIRAVEESMEDNKDFILNFANDVGE